MHCCFATVSFLRVWRHEEMHLSTLQNFYTSLPKLHITFLKFRNALLFCHRVIPPCGGLEECTHILWNFHTSLPKLHNVSYIP